MAADPGAVTKPDSARPEHTPQLARSRRVAAVAGSQREVLVVTGQVVSRTPAAVARSRRCGAGTWAGAARGWLGAARNRVRKGREPVVRVGPGRGLSRIDPGCADPLGQPGQLIAAALPDSGERNRVPGQVERDLVWLANLVPAGHSLDGQHGAVDAT